jgi:hypothetical protein
MPLAVQGRLVYPRTARRAHKAPYQGHWDCLHSQLGLPPFALGLPPWALLPLLTRPRLPVCADIMPQRPADAVGVPTHGTLSSQSAKRRIRGTGTSSIRTGTSSIALLSLLTRPRLPVCAGIMAQRPADASGVPTHGTLSSQSAGSGALEFPHSRWNSHIHAFTPAYTSRHLVLCVIYELCLFII